MTTTTAALLNNRLNHKLFANQKINQNRTSIKPIPLIERILEILLYRFRWVFVIWFILPASILYNSYYVLRNWIIFQLKLAPKSHDRKVLRIQRQVSNIIKKFLF